MNRPIKRRLSKLELNELCVEGVNKEAVWNFLGTLPQNTSVADDLANLSMDSDLYKWGESTNNAIRRGIGMALK